MKRLRKSPLPKQGAFLFVTIIWLQETHLNHSHLRSEFKHSAREIIGSKVKAMRQLRKLTQEELGDLIGATRQYVCRIEKGEINLTLDYVDKLAKALDVDQNYFLNTNS